MEPAPNAAPDPDEPSRPYHHGDLRAALLAEAEGLIEERGLTGFSLRAVAKRAGVSHAAPAHHFGDARGLLTALAAQGFRQLLEAQKRRRRAAGDDASARLVASGLGYVDFALARPALFGLTFDAERLDWDDATLRDASDAAFERLRGESSQSAGRPPGSPEAMDALRVAWSLAHGVSALLIQGHLSALSSLEPEARDAALVAMFRRALR